MPQTSSASHLPNSSFQYQYDPDYLGERGNKREQPDILISFINPLPEQSRANRVPPLFHNPFSFFSWFACVAWEPILDALHPVQSKSAVGFYRVGDAAHPTLHSHATHGNEGKSSSCFRMLISLLSHYTGIQAHPTSFHPRG
jgi:hypothetical protein